MIVSGDADLLAPSRSAAFQSYAGSSFSSVRRIGAEFGFPPYMSSGAGRRPRRGGRGLPGRCEGISQGSDGRHRQHDVSVRRQCRVHRRTLHPLSRRPRSRSTRAGGGFSPKSATMPAALNAERAGPSWAHAPRPARQRGNGAAAAAPAIDAEALRRAATDSIRALQADPRLPGARPSRSRSRSARARAARPSPRARLPDLRLHRGRSRPRDLHQQSARPRARHLARDHRDPARDLLRPDRRRVHAHPGARRAAMDPGEIRDAASAGRA